MPKKRSSKKVRIAINGFGRIGRAAFRIALNTKNVEIVAINDLVDAKTLAHLLQYDTAYGMFDKKVSATAKTIGVGGKRYPVYAEKDPLNLPWKELNVDVVLECTGHFVKDDAAMVHIKAGAKRVVLSAPAKGGTCPTYLLGVNQKKFKRSEKIVSNASCTTNSIAPVAEVLNRRFGIAKAMITTIHSYTADQRLQDAPHRDLRRARAAAQNIVPTTTGAAIATTKVIPQLKNKFDGMAVRVPTIVVSLSDFTFLLKKKVTDKQINRAFIDAAKSAQYKGILGVTEKPLVSSDFIGNPLSSIVDLSLTKVVDGNLVKVVAWYDNEWGYSNRLIDMALHVA